MRTNRPTDRALSRPEPPIVGQPWAGFEVAVRHAWSLFHEARVAQGKFVVQPSAPILFFGDSAAYLDSPLRVISVGLNPSRIEFNGADPFHRFPDSKGINDGSIMDSDIVRYLRALNAYYHTDPYWTWFRYYEAVLHGLDASFAPGKTNTALHTDICSPVATDPTWSKLPKAVIEHLMRGGVTLWHDLVSLLSPDVIVMSINAKYRDAVSFPRLQEWQPLFTVARTNPHTTSFARIEIAPRKHALLVFGRAAQAPFATVKDIDKTRIGEAAKRIIDGS